MALAQAPPDIRQVTTTMNVSRLVQYNDRTLVNRAFIVKCTHLWDLFR